jgi:phage-related protein
MKTERKPVHWMGSALKDLRKFPEEPRRVISHALDLAQQGKKYVAAKPMKGYKGAGVLEIVDDDDGNTYRAVYTVRFPGAIYALHAFQKKSKSGIMTPKQEIDLVNQRLKEAEAHYKVWRSTQKEKKS